MSHSFVTRSRPFVRIRYDISTIEDGFIYISDGSTAQELECLQDHQISMVINCTKGVPSAFANRRQHKISYLRIRVDDEDDEDLMPFFSIVYDALEDSAGAVLVHCHQGVSRSASFVIAYYMRKHEMTYDAALDFVRLGRSKVDPNAGFESQLREYGRRLADGDQVPIEPLPSPRVIFNWWWERKPDVDISQILPGRLFLSSGSVSSNGEALVYYKIGLILNVTEYIENCYERDPSVSDEELTGEELVIDYFRIPADDCIEFDMKPFFEPAWERIEAVPPDQAILVHCAAGVSRSATIVISYLMRKMKIGVDEAWKFVLNRRSVIAPNRGFEKQLRLYEAELRESGVLGTEKGESRQDE